MPEADEELSAQLLACQSYVDMQSAGHMTVSGAKTEDWLDAGQYTDCFLPAFNFRPKTSIQAGLATTHFSDDQAQMTRFQWGFIASSDNHHARSRDAIWDTLQRRETYATSGQKILLWFHALGRNGEQVPTGSRLIA